MMRLGFISEMKGWINILKSINVKYNISGIKEKDYMNFSMDKKRIWQISIDIHYKNNTKWNKTLSKPKTED